MAGLQDALVEASRRAQEEQQKAHERNVRDKLIEYHRDMYGFAAQYDNIIVLAGYAAFFALWSSVSDDITRFARLATATLMGLSLMFYILWQTLTMLSRQKFEWEKAGAFQYANEPEKFNSTWVEIADREAKGQNKILRLWLPIYLPSVLLGFAAGIVLVWNTAAVAFGLPQLTGRW